MQCQQWVATGTAGVADIVLIESELPSPGPGEVVIEVRAAGVNPADLKHAMRQDGHALPWPIGYEVAGEIAALGPDTEIASGPASIGDPVLAFRVAGGYATALTVPGNDVFHRPDALDEPSAATLLLAATTAADMLRVTGAAPGETMLLLGAAGAVGMAVLQLAARDGVRVVGVAGDARLHTVRELGGEAVAWGDDLAARIAAAAPAPIVAALDASGAPLGLDAALDLVPDRARIVTIADAPRAARDGFRAIAGSQPESAAYRAAVRADLIALAADGRLRMPPVREIPFADAHEALTLAATGRAAGKLALIPDA